MICYEGTVQGFRTYGLRELRKAAMAGMDLADPRDRRRLQRSLRKAQIKDLSDQIRRNRGGDAA